MLIKNCNIIYLDKIELGSVLIEDGKIKEINPKDTISTNVIDANGLYLSPGFIDVHIHGAGGYDTMDGTIDAINKISKVICKHGTTSFLPTTMTVSINQINKALLAIKYCKLNGTDGANCLGAHIEGPFISPKAIGAQNPAFLLNPTLDNYHSIVKNAEDSVVSITIAPELPGALDLIKHLSTQGIKCSIGHTNCTYQEALDGIKCGCCHSTHLFNGMSAFNHREPGAVGAIFDSNISTETISDGIHISYPALRIAYKLKGSDNVLLITDAMMACDMPDGLYSLGGQDVVVSNGAARLTTGSLAGSVLTLDKAIRNVYKNINLPLYEIVKMATFNSAKFCGVQNKKGLIKENYDADLVLFDKDINIKKVLIKGKVLAI